MTFRNVNWPTWAGLLLTLFAFLSYPTLFAQYPITRDVPWVNLLLFSLAAILLVMGIRRAPAGEKPRRRKITAWIVTTVSALAFGFFVFGIFVFARQLPSSKGAPQVGQKAPDFAMQDIEGKRVTLDDLLSAPVAGEPAKGVLLVFYRGYW